MNASSTPHRRPARLALPLALLLGTLVLVVDLPAPGGAGWLHAIGPVAAAAETGGGGSGPNGDPDMPESPEPAPTRSGSGLPRRIGIYDWILSPWLPPRTTLETLSARWPSFTVR